MTDEEKRVVEALKIQSVEAICDTRNCDDCVCNQYITYAVDKSCYSGTLIAAFQMIERLCMERDAAKADAEANRNELRAIVSLPNCNDCGHKVCMHRSPLGQRVRFNCPLWTAKGESQRGPCAENGGMKR